MLTSWLTGADRLIGQIAPPWLLSLALFVVAAILALVALNGRPALKASVLAWTVAP